MQNNFSRTHLAILAAVWLLFAVGTFYITHSDLNDKGRVLLTSVGTISGPMTGAIARGGQSCCLEFSLVLLPYCGFALVAAAAFQFVKLPMECGATAVRLIVWTLGLLVWFMGGIVSFAHALS